MVQGMENSLGGIKKKEGKGTMNEITTE